MVPERQVSLGCVIAAGLWLLAFLLLLGGTTVALVGAGHNAVTLAMSLMAHALLVAAGAATLTVRNMFAGQNRLLKEAFKLGQDTNGQVRQFRS